MLTLILAAATAAQALNAFAGSWNGSGKDYKTPLSTADTVRDRIVCTWTEQHVFLVCPGSVSIDRRPKRLHQLAIYTYDPTAKKYRFTATTPAGTFTPTLTRSQNTWTYESLDTDAHGVKKYWRTLNVFSSADSYRYRVQYSHDGKHWVTTGTGVSTRASK